MSRLTDSFGRVHDYLQLTITDRCNMHCAYCRRTEFLDKQIARELMISLEETYRIINIFVSRLGFRKIKLTGGEPLLRKGVFTFLDRLGQLKIKSPFELGIVSNGTYLGQHLERLKYAGIDSLTVSLASLNESSFAAITTVNSMNKVLTSVLKAEEMEFPKIKLNVVIIKGINDQELPAFTELSKARKITVQFVEYSPAQWNHDVVDGLLTTDAMIERLRSYYDLVPVLTSGLEKTGYYTIPGHKGRIRFVTSHSDHVCVSCNRLQISVEGILRSCRYDSNNDFLNLKDMLAKGMTDDEIIGEIYALTDRKHKERIMTDEASI